MQPSPDKNNNYDFRILIIDDNPEIHKDFIKTLTSINSTTELHSLGEKLFGKKANEQLTGDKSFQPLPKFEINTATQGKEGVDEILNAIKAGKPYALAFVDIRMPPGWDGIETIKHIWELDKDIQIVICTAYSDYSWEETIAELGPTDNLLILKKPFDHIAVRQLACALTRKWKLMQESRSYTEALESKVQKRTEELNYLAMHDSLTNLPNRVLLEERIKTAIWECDKNNKYTAILFFDLDRFKLVNDSLGHSAGDELLKVISRRLQAYLRDSDTLARIGGDEFVLVIRDLDRYEESASIAASLLTIISQSMNVANHNLAVTSSIGISVFPKDGHNMEDLIRNADMAMYCAKEWGGNQFQYFTPEMNDVSIRTLTIETELRQAIQNQEFFLVYQPQFDLKSSQLAAVEALIRWNHPEKGVLLPMDFITIAEESGLIVPIGEWVLREACLQNKAWQDEGLPPIRVAVNITTQQIRYFNFVDSIKDILKETGLDPSYLELELTENTIINNATALKVMNALKDMNIRIALDDFDTGYSSLNYLRNVPLDRLKIDRSFVQNILINRGDEVVIQAIISMARGLNLEVLAEGVETQKQLDFLKSKKCDEIQGFYFSNPLSSEELIKLLANKADIQEILKTQ